ncbi:MAG: response regulator [Eubacteriales bacterium]|nr:response regulator [Eubacteriales bacterium]
MYRAVIVDDEPFMLEGMRIMVGWQRCGFTLCGEATSAQEALRLVDTLQPHLLITDVRMPGMLGTDLASIVNRYHPGVIILFFSGHRDFAYAQSAIRSHAFGYLVKPIDPDEVEATLARVKAELDARSTREQTGEKAPILRDQVLRRIALGDDSPESLLRTGVLMELGRNDPCYCAVLAREHGSVPENAKLVLSASGALPFQLSPGQYGLGFRQMERNLPLLEHLWAALADTASLTLSVGGVHRGPQGFGRSLREALDAQGALFEKTGSLRVYKPVDAPTAAWLSQVRLAALREALADENPEALEAQLVSLRQSAAQTQPSLFTLRYMAATLDAILPMAVVDKQNSRFCALWQQETMEPQAWLDAFCSQLRGMRSAVKLETGEGWPAAVQATVAAIRTRYAEVLSMNGIAEEQHMNPAYLGQLMRRHTGVTFHRRLLATRIEHACLLLRQTARPVGEIAMEVGFRDVDYFSQQFRSLMGMSPVAYRGAETAREDAHATHQ